MADEEVQTGEVQEGQEEEQVIEENPELEAVKAELERYKAKHDEAERHRKEAERKAKDIERERTEAERKQAEEEGNHQKLWETEKERADRLEQELADRDKQLQERAEREIEMMRDGETSNIVGELTTDAKRQKALKKLVREHVQVQDGEKQYTVDGVSIDKARFVKYIRDEYPSLVDGTGMSGGGAPGATGSGAANSVTTNADVYKAKGDLTGFLQAQINR